MTNDLQAMLSQENDPERLKTMILVADMLVRQQAAYIEEQHLLLVEADEILSEIEQDADRYALLKLILPQMLGVAAHTGFNTGSAEASEMFASLDASKLDETLDAYLDTGLLEKLEEAAE